MAVKSILLIAILVVSIIPITLIDANAEEDTCNGHTIKSINNNTVKVDGKNYNNGAKITLNGKTYKIIIGSGSIEGTEKNDFIVSSNKIDGNALDPVNGLEGDDFIVGLGGHDYLAGGEGDDIICGNDGFDTLYGDWLEALEAGNDKLEGGKGEDKLYGDYIVLGDMGEKLKGGKDKLKGGEADDHLYGDFILGGKGNDTITGGNDELEGEAGEDKLYGDWLEGGFGKDNASGGNDIIAAKDGAKDQIDGDSIDVDAEKATKGMKDICLHDEKDKAIMKNCDIVAIGKLEATNPIKIGGVAKITFSSSVDNVITITNMTVKDPNNNLCKYNGKLPIIVQKGGKAIFTYPNDFVDQQNKKCNTKIAGNYTATLYTKIGDPITVVFNTSFNVLPESTIGAIGVIGASIVAFMLYARRK